MILFIFNEKIVYKLRDCNSDGKELSRMRGQTHAHDLYYDKNFCHDTEYRMDKFNF